MTQKSARGARPYPETREARCGGALSNLDKHARRGPIGSAMH